MMLLAGGSDLEQAIAETDDAMPVASELAGGESRPCLDLIELKH